MRTDPIKAPLEANTHSFVVRVWLEETVETDGRAVWRGHITHVITREKRYLEDLESIIIFIVPYLEAMGVEISWRWRVRQWWQRRWRKQKI